MQPKKTLLIILINLFSLTAFAQLRLPSVIDDNMVLQQNKPAIIWGWASPGKKLDVHFRGKEYSTIVNIKGEWKISMLAGKAGRGGDIAISSGNEKKTIKNILIGEVWVCSGQSNMEWRMKQLPDSFPIEQKTCTNDQIRFLTVKNTYDNKERNDATLIQKWTAIDPNTLGECSAVAYYFAKKIQARLKIPVGLIITCWGGTFAQSWMDSSSLKSFPKYDSLFKREISPLNFAELDNKQKAIQEEFKEDIVKGNSLFKEAVSINYNDEQWSPMQVPGSWENRGYPDIDGIAAYRIEFNLAIGDENKPAILHLPAIDDMDTTYLNGSYLGTMNVWNALRVYSVAPGILKAGKNVISIWVQDNQGEGGLFDDSRNFFLQLGEQKIPLTGSKASFKILATVKTITEHVAYVAMQNQPTVLFDAMIAPLLNYKIRGFIWYQGESNAEQYIEYRKLFPAMINCWRRRWNNDDLPFLFTQLSSYNPSEKEPAISNWAGLREAQAMALQLPNTGMAVSIDVGNRYDIHPLLKKEVGDRLALNAFKMLYGFKNEVYSGPVFLLAKNEGTGIKVLYKNTGSGLMVKGEKLLGFSIAGSDKKFMPADAVIEGNDVFVSSKSVTAPKYIRYAWADAPLEANLFNKEGLPAAPFRTDREN